MLRCELVTFQSKFYLGPSGCCLRSTKAMWMHYWTAHYLTQEECQLVFIFLPPTLPTSKRRKAGKALWIYHSFNSTRSPCGLSREAKQCVQCGQNLQLGLKINYVSSWVLPGPRWVLLNLPALNQSKLCLLTLTKRISPTYSDCMQRNEKMCP